MTDSVSLNNLKKKLEEQATKEVVKLKEQPIQGDSFKENLVKIMEDGHKEFTEKIGRPMTYSEMREMYG